MKKPHQIESQVRRFPAHHERGIGVVPAAWLYPFHALVPEPNARSHFPAARALTFPASRAIPYNPGMVRIGPALPISGLLLLSLAFAGEKKIATAQGGNDEVQIKATFVDQDQLKQMVGTDFGKMFTALELELTPKNGKPVIVTYDDFELLSESSGEHGGPYEAGQISGSGALVLHREDKYGAIGVNPTSGVWSMGPIMAGSGSQPKPTDKRADMVQGDSKRDPLTDLLQQKMLPEQTASAPESGLLIFPLSHEKPKHLVLFYKTASGKLRMNFKN
jgi:hypothetical protein